jgi:hypothetical protein
MRSLARASIIVLILSALAVTASRAGEILSISGPRGISYTLGEGPAPADVEILAVSWSQTQSYSNVEISALLNAIQPGNTVDAYLLQGTVPQPVANQVAHSTVALTTGDADYTFFSGLTLAAGTYSLVLDSFTSQPDTVGWISTLSPTIVNDTGVTLLDGLLSSNGNNSQPPYPPNAPNFRSLASLGNFEFTLTSIPEPSSLIMGSISAFLGMGCWWKRRSRECSLQSVTGTF